MTDRNGRGRSAEDHVYGVLREQIEQGLEPGTPLRLSVIAASAGVSTMPVRAALRRLEGDGLVRQIARRGTVVAPLELDDLEEIQVIRWGIEGLAARLGAHATYDLEDACYAAAGRPRLLATVHHDRRAAQRYVRVAGRENRGAGRGPRTN